MTRPLAALLATLLLASALGAYFGAYAYFKAQELERVSARLSLLRSTLDEELRRFSHLPFVLAQDNRLVTALEARDVSGLNAHLAAVAARAGIDAIFLMDRSGLTLAASNADTPDSFVGQSYGFRPYFQAALAGELGKFYGIGATTGIPGYFYAEAVRGTDRPLGVVAIKIDLSDLQERWFEAGERVILANADGVTLLASDPAWRYRALTDLSEEQRARIAEARQFGREPLPLLDWAPDPQRRTAEIGGARFLYRSADGLSNGWSLHLFAPDAPAQTSAMLTTGALVLLAGTMLIVLQRRRVRRIGEALRRSEVEEATLRSANARLAVEIEERRSAEHRLRKTQDELERAGRLAALGRLAASVTHELGQPIAAMRNHLAAAEMQGNAPALVERLQGLTDRMEGITRQLKFFSRKGRDAMEPMDLREAVRASSELLLPGPDVALDVALPPQPVPVVVNRLRIEQVLTNLMRNALDATAEVASPRIVVRLGEDDSGAWITVSDNGHGLGGRSFDDLKEPFATTRASGEGMGLGLTISAGIVSDHGGEMIAESRPNGGAVFSVRLPSSPAETRRAS